MTLRFKPTDNVKAIKGLAMKHLSPDLRKKVSPKSLHVSLNEKPLKDADRLVDLEYAKSTVIVQYPDAGN